MSWLSDFFNPGGAYQAAQDRSRQGYNEGQQFYQPYNQHGLESGDQLQKLLAMLSDPTKLQGEWAKSYQTSPEALQKQQEAKTSGLDAASSMGLLGSSSAVNNIQTGASNIANQDRDSYLNRLMQTLQQGIGVGQNLYGVGANAANQQGQNAIHQGDTQAQLDFQRKNAGSNFLSQLGQGGIEMLLKYLTGGLGQGSYGRGSLTPVTK